MQPTTLCFENNDVNDEEDGASFVHSCMRSYQSTYASSGCLLHGTWNLPMYSYFYFYHCYFFPDPTIHETYHIFSPYFLFFHFHLFMYFSFFSFKKMGHLARLVSSS